MRSVTTQWKGSLSFFSFSRDCYRAGLDSRWLVMMLVLLGLLAPDLGGAAEPVVAEIYTSVAKERLLVRGVKGREPVWCGNTHVVLYREGSGPVIVEVATGRTRTIPQALHLIATDCSPDGRWLILIDKRHDPQLWRFNRVTGKRARFAYGHLGRFSPDGTKVMMQRDIFVKRPTPKSVPPWELVWADLMQTENKDWLPDSQGLLIWNRGTFYSQYGDQVTPVIVDTPFNDIQKGYSVGTIVSRASGQTYLLVDTKDRTIHPTPPGPSRQLFSCTLTSGHLACRGLTPATEEVAEFTVSRDGTTVVYTDSSENRCLNRLEVARGTITHCLVANAGYGLALSPDGIRVVFTHSRQRGPGDIDDSSDVNDAYMLEIP